jgi:hypothetical protein
VSSKPFTCPARRKQPRLPDQAEGRQLRCPACKSIITVSDTPARTGRPDAAPAFDGLDEAPAVPLVPVVKAPPAPPAVYPVRRAGPEKDGFRDRHPVLFVALVAGAVMSGGLFVALVVFAGHADPSRATFRPGPADREDRRGPLELLDSGVHEGDRPGAAVTVRTHLGPSHRRTGVRVDPGRQDGQVARAVRPPPQQQAGGLALGGGRADDLPPRPAPARRVGPPAGRGAGPAPAHVPAGRRPGQAHGRQ